MEKHLDKLR